MTLNSIEAAKLEASGAGAFSISGRAIMFRRADGMVCSWPCRTGREARQHLAMFRRSVVLVAA